MSLREKQALFMRLMAELIKKIYESGYECTGGDLWSKPEYKAHRPNSNHYVRLAIDINLFKDNEYLSDTEAHRQFGEFWESLHPFCRWGGRFHDGNHYELTPEPWR